MTRKEYADFRYEVDKEYGYYSYVRGYRKLDEKEQIAYERYKARKIRLDTFEETILTEALKPLDKNHFK